ncbi:glycosyltransferase [Bradyrhizobium sp. CB1650]|uniref:glycosyltransferase n=1 Tax=Bradyrhizobium sp. CB1650 TaxID=3039153 RepID=UPI002434F317|nr:glycosyltransferase [Bradyrhizobium sp. CB1650]WGD54999.1 glycosyltransferase [Bradyrhizobium sp. CB1650]
MALRVGALCWEIARSRPTVIMGIYIMPHGLIAFALGRLTRRRVCIHVIGGPREIIDGGYWVDQWQVRRPSKRLERLYLAVLRHTDMIMVVGSETKRYLVAQGVPAERVHLMSSKIDPERFHPMPQIARDYDLVLTAQLIPRKRVDLFLRLVADLRRLHSHIRAVVVGDGPQRPELESIAARLDVSGCVDFVGFHEETEMYYNRAKIFVLTSSAEGLSLAMLEAMACGLPAVVPAVGDLADVVRDGETGYLVPDDDQEAFVRALSRLIESDDLRQRLGQTARATILDGYTVHDGARRWDELLSSEPRVSVHSV